MLSSLRATQLFLLVLIAVCAAKKLRSPASDSSSVLVTTGIINGSLLFMTSNSKGHYLVYEYPVSALDLKAHRLITAGVEPVNLKDKWAVLQNEVHNAIQTSAVVQDAAKNDFIFLVARNDDQNNETCFFDPKVTVTKSSISWDGNVWLSGSDIKRYYSLKTSPGLALAEYELGYNSPESSQNLADSNMVQLKSGFFAICIKGDKVQLTNGKCDNAAKWKVTAGLVVNGWFYMFGPKAVYAFEKSSFDKPGSKMKLAKASLKAFFGEAELPTTKSTTDSHTQVGNRGVSIFVFTVVSILFAIILTACIYVIVCGDGKKKPLIGQDEKMKVDPSTRFGAKPKTTNSNTALSDALKVKESKSLYAAKQVPSSKVAAVTSAKIKSTLPSSNDIKQKSSVDAKMATPKEIASSVKSELPKQSSQLTSAAKGKKFMSLMSLKKAQQLMTTETTSH